MSSGRKAINVNIVGFRWVYKVKQISDGSVQCLKARLVAQGYNQHEGVNLTYGYSLVVKLTTIRCVLTLEINNGWKLHPTDVRNVFLNGDKNEEVYLKQPSGFEDKNYPRHVCRLRKALYRLHQPHDLGIPNSHLLY